MKSNHFLLLAMTVLLMAGACSPPSPNTNSATAAAAVSKGQSLVSDDLSQKNILHIALGSKDHSTLVAAVQAAGMEDVLANAGPLTVFAPTNEAFAKLPPGTVENLLKPENKQTLARIIKYHASPGTFRVDNLTEGMNMYMASGHYIKLTKEGDQISIQGAKILGSADASNGVVHIIDTVLLPPE